MGSSFLSVLGSIATVALIAIATRWLSSAKGLQLPKTHDGISVYGIEAAVAGCWLRGRNVLGGCIDLVVA